MSTLKKILVDSLSSLTYSFGVFGCVELYVAQMDPPEVVQSRLAMGAYNFAIGRPYGYILDKVRSFAGVTDESSRTKKAFVDIAVELGVFMPAYYLTLKLTGTSPEETQRAMLMSAVVGSLSGRPHGVWTDSCRRWTGIEE